MMTTKNIFRRVAIVLVFALVITSFPGIGNVSNKVQAATTAGNVVYEGNGSLSCGGSTLTLKDAVLTFSGSTTIKYWNNPVAGTMVINQTDKLGHVFWYSGIYFVIDMNNGTIIQAYKNSSNSYCLKSSGTAVYGSSAYMATINTCIIDDEWFYQEGIAKMQHLMTRVEFDKISNGQDPAQPTIEPTVAPTQEPTPTIEPTVAPTQEPTPTIEPTVAPTATPDIIINTDIKFDIEYWYKEYTSGKITWEQFTTVASTYGWKVEGETVTKTVTDRVFDDKGNCVHEETYTVTYKKESGNGQSNTNISNNGNVEYEEKNEGEGEIKGDVNSKTEIIINVPTPKPTAKPKDKTKLSLTGNTYVAYPKMKIIVPYSATNAKGKSCKVTATSASKNISVKVNSSNKLTITVGKNAKDAGKYKVMVKNGSKKAYITVFVYKHRVVTSGRRIKLFMKDNKLYGWLLFDVKKGTLYWNGIERKGIVNAGFIEDSWNIGVILKNGTVESISYKSGKTKKIGSSAKTFRRNNRGCIVSYVKKDNKTVKKIIGK